MLLLVLSFDPSRETNKRARTEHLEYAYKINTAEKKRKKNHTTPDGSALALKRDHRSGLLATYNCSGAVTRAIARALVSYGVYSRRERVREQFSIEKQSERRAFRAMNAHADTTSKGAAIGASGVFMRGVWEIDLPLTFYNYI